jgi:hypothetical protein
MDEKEASLLRRIFVEKLAQVSSKKMMIYGRYKSDKQTYFIEATNKKTDRTTWIGWYRCISIGN